VSGIECPQKRGEPPTELTRRITSGAFPQTVELAQGREGAFPASLTVLTFVQTPSRLITHIAQHLPQPPFSESARGRSKSSCEA
jgi:hypothetical protein